MMDLLSSFWGDQDALTTVEYALLVALVVVVAAAGWQNFGETLANSADEPIAVLSGNEADG
jgi:Flp pilus assembly pilin Flp